MDMLKWFVSSNPYFCLSTYFHWVKIDDDPKDLEYKKKNNGNLTLFVICYKQQNFNPMKICASTVICTNLEKIPNSRTLTW